MLNKNAGRPIKIISIFMFILGCIAALVILIGSISQSNEYGMLLAIAVVIVQFVISTLIYGFGQLIEDTMECKKHLINLDKESIGSEAEDSRISTPDNSKKKDSYISAPDDSKKKQNFIICPECRRKNRLNREYCWNCGTEFTKE